VWGRHHTIKPAGINVSRAHRLIIFRLDGYALTNPEDENKLRSPQKFTAANYRVNDLEI
jgi:hypothetical protein